MNLITLIKIAIVLVVAFFGIEALRVRNADQKLQSYAGASAVFPAGDGPLQGSASGKGFEFRGYQVKPLASFAVRARVLAREDYRLGREADLSPVDLALGWKRMADPESLFTISLGSRSGLCGMGCKARWAANSSAIGKRRNVADRPQSPLPEGLE